jgi:Cytochrome P460
MGAYAYSRLAAFVCLIAFIIAIGFSLHRPGSVKAAAATTPAYAKNGDMLPPVNYREWIYLTSGIDMSYSPKAMDKGAGMSMFDNVFVNPEAYRGFLATGTWPDKTVMILEGREARSKGSINQRGHFQAVGIADIEVHVKDEARFPGKWAFFAFDSLDKNGTLIPKTAPCYSCHQEHGAVDTTFVQFYPTLLPIAQKKGTLSAESLQDEHPPQASK